VVNIDIDRNTWDGKQDIELGRAWSEGLVHWDQDINVDMTCMISMMGGLTGVWVYILAQSFR
jgi:hypothetical protein